MGMSLIGGLVDDCRLDAVGLGRNCCLILLTRVRGQCRLHWSNKKRSVRTGLRNHQRGPFYAIKQRCLAALAMGGISPRL